MSQHWSTIKEAGALSGMRFLILVYKTLGRTGFNIILLPVMAYFFIRRPGARRASRDFLRRVRAAYPDSLPKRSITWLSFRHFLAFGHSLLDKYIAWSQTPTDIAMDPGEEKMLFELVTSGKGCLMIGSHFGNLEYSRGISGRHPELVINVLLYDRHAENFSALMEKVKADSRMNLIQVTDMDMALAFTLREKVQRGEWVVIAGDRVPVGEGGRVCSAEFFGARADFPVGPYVLANLLHCPVYLMHCFLAEDDYFYRVEFFEEDFQVDRKNRQQAYEKAAQRFASSLEKQVARYPLQWFNFFDFWRAHEEQEPRESRSQASD
jgi:predicted LPLAT superfamily acyltransferase